MTQGSRRSGDRGSASIWVLAAGVVILLAAVVVTIRTSAVVVRHRAESAADLAALAAAGGIGVDGSDAQICLRGKAIAAANGAGLASCSVQLDGGGRSGTVDIAVVMTVRLAGVGTQQVSARSRAGRLPAGTPVAR